MTSATSVYVVPVQDWHKCKIEYYGIVKRQFFLQEVGHVGYSTFLSQHGWLHCPLLKADSASNPSNEVRGNVIAVE